ncbi:MAG: hypothetical protein Q8L10_01625 [Candidatus Moranbacteria bacterium]|nr:hypothetical protein [Candidatus Moranbacteria bacterium]
MGKIRLKNIGPWTNRGPRAAIKSFFAQEYFKSHIAIWLLILSLTANLINWVILKIWIQPVDFPIILHYNVYFGVDLVGDYRQVYSLPLIGFILLIINSALSIYFYGQKERIASYILLMAVLMIQLSLIVASASVILINY